MQIKIFTLSIVYGLNKPDNVLISKHASRQIILRWWNSIYFTDQGLFKRVSKYSYILKKLYAFRKKWPYQNSVACFFFRLATQAHIGHY